jgi:hypothetical protein
VTVYNISIRQAAADFCNWGGDDASKPLLRFARLGALTRSANHKENESWESSSHPVLPSWVSH